MIGILVSVACMLVLSVIMMSSLNKAMSGAGNALSGTAASLTRTISAKEATA